MGISVYIMYTGVLTAFQVNGFWREAKKSKKSSCVRYADRLNLDMRAANLRTREIFFVRYKTEKSTRAQNHADQR